MSTLEEINVAAAALSPDEQAEFFRWWTESDIFRARQLTALKRDLAIGIEQLEHGRYRTYDDANVMRLAEEVSKHGRKRLKIGRRQPSAATPGRMRSAFTGAGL
jgi:hypothetical protein